MPYVDPQTIHNPATGTIATAAWGDVVRDDLEWLADPPRGSMSHNTTQNHTSSGSFVAALANTEAQDTFAMHSTSSNTSRITVPTNGDGDYFFEAVIEFASNSTGIRQLKAVKNGSTDIFGAAANAVSGAAHRITAPFYIPDLVATDYIEFFGFQNSGGTLAMQLLRASWRWVGR